MPKTLLLISSDQVDEIFASEICKKADLELLHVTDPLEGARKIQEAEIAITLVDASSHQAFKTFETALQESVGLFSEKINSNYIHFLSVHDLDKIEYLSQSPLFGNFVFKNYQSAPNEAGQNYGRIIKASLLERAFGLTNLLGPEVKVQTVKLGTSAQKIDAVEAIRSYIKAAKFQDRMAALISNAVDELLLNAIYDAPVDALGKPIYSTTSRSTVLQLSGHSEVEMSVGFDGKYVAITVTDHHGSLNKAKLIAHISKIYVREEYKIKTSVAGAGIGLANVFLTGGSFLFVSEAGVKTQVTVFFKKGANYREFREQFRFISTQFYL